MSLSSLSDKCSVSLFAIVRVDFPHELNFHFGPYAPLLLTVFFNQVSKCLLM